MDRAAAQAMLEGYTLEALGEPGRPAQPGRVAFVRPATLAKAIAKAEARLNRAARRALGARGDGRYHELVRHKAVPRSRPALRTRRSR